MTSAIDIRRRHAVLDATPRRSKSFAISRASLWSIGLLLIVPVGTVALLSGAGLIRLPFEMFLLAERVPIIFRAHMLSAAVALLLLPITISVRKRPDLHRVVGRTLGGFVVLAGLTALPVAALSASAPLARAGFFAQGLVWLWLLFQGWTAIRAGERARHAKFMLAMAAVTTGAVWFRLLTGAAILLHLPFKATYAFAAWAGWLVPLVIVWMSPRLVRSLYPRA